VSKPAASVASSSAIPANAYRGQILVRFADCDSAKMVFYPRYLEMFNDLVEDWFREGLALPFDVMHRDRGWGLPTVHVEVDFVAPCRLGEVISAALSVERIGKTSIELQIILRGPEGSDRVRGHVVLVLTDMAPNRARLIPQDLRERLEGFRISA
jgi:4-hydroxybenzoyl-CoA thioesterase